MSIPAYVGYAGLFAWIFLGESGVPIFVPAELALFAAGVAAAHHSASLGAVIALALAADVLGGLCLYSLVRFVHGRSGRLGRLERLIERAADHAHKLGARSPMRVAAARCIPFLRISSALAAALAGLKLPAFTAALAIGGTVWVGVFLGAGFWFTREALHV